MGPIVTLTFNNRISTNKILLWVRVECFEVTSFPNPVKSLMYQDIYRYIKCYTSNTPRPIKSHDSLSDTTVQISTVK